MPKLWTETIETHRASVRDATVEATASLVAEYGLRGITMSRIADVTGIGRATLYKYFPDVESILLAWHHREVAGHLEQLERARKEAVEPDERLRAVLSSYAHIAHRAGRHHEHEIAAWLHHDERVADAHQQVLRIVSEAIAAAARTGSVRTDTSADELAGYCLHALAAARDLRSPPAVRRLIDVTLAGLRPSE